MTIQIDSLKDKIYDRFLDQCDFVGDGFDDPSSPLYLVYHYCLTSRRFDGIFSDLEDAVNRARLLSRKDVKTKYHVIRMDLGIKYICQVESQNY